MSIKAVRLVHRSFKPCHFQDLERRFNSPLKIVWPRIFMLLIRTEGTYIAWRVMHQAMPHHFILALEPFPTQPTWTPIHRTEMRPVLRVHICMRAGNCGLQLGVHCHDTRICDDYMLRIVIGFCLLEQILSLERCCRTPSMRAFIAARRSGPMQGRIRTQRGPVGARLWCRSNRLCRCGITRERACGRQGGRVVG
jgi:hypothetical protein